MVEEASAQVRITAGGVTRVLELRHGTPRTVALGTGDDLIRVTGSELAVVLDTSRWRYDIPVWRHRVAEQGADEASWASPDTDDGDWRVVPHLQPVLVARATGGHWFRARVAVPSAYAQEPVDLVLGGLDDLDWQRYRVWVDGEEVADRRGQGRIREPHRIRLSPGVSAREAMGGSTGALIAVRCEGLDRDVPGRAEGELGHHLFQDWLLDQYLAVGGPTDIVDDFAAFGPALPLPGGGLEVTLASGVRTGLSATIRYAAEGDLVRKRVTLANDGSEALRVLDVVLDELQLRGDARLGGRGQPVFLGDAFMGIEHPAGVAQVDRGRLRLVQMPGLTLGPGERWEARPVVLGGGPGGTVEASFRRYIEGLRPRPDRRITVYSALGWYDFTNPADPLPELTAELVAENLDQLAALAEAGARFDVYMFDDWWERTDLRSFRRSTFPEGASALVERIEAMGMRAGLWWATSRAVWSADRAPGLDTSWANDPSHSASLDLSGGAWRWTEEFTNLFVGERRLCLAAEPYRSMYLEAIPRQVGALRAAVLKLDCVVLHCTSSAHDHRPGRHSMEPMVDALEGLVERCRVASPDLRALWYWGFRSPWFLLSADVTFDKGLLMEAATVASSPAPTTRQSLTLNVDQAIRHARWLPLPLQDSLGVWIGDVAWCNRIGADEWPEALLIDAARGSDLVQLWGDLTLLDDPDRAMLGAILRWWDRQRDAHQPTVELGGDPWRGEAYGYARPADGGLVATLVNPAWSAASVRLDRSLPGWPTEGAGPVEVYPFPGRVAADLPATPGGGLTVELAPWETRVVWMAPVTAGDGTRQARPPVRPSRRLTVAGERGGHAIRLPTVGREDAVYLAHRLRRDGEWAYDAEPQALVSSIVTLDGLAVASTTLPRTRDRNGPGSPWVLQTIPAGPAWSDRTLEVRIEDRTPGDVEVVTEAWLVERWWRRHRRTFRDPLS